MKNLLHSAERRNTPTMLNKRSSLFPSLEMGADFNRAIDTFTDIFRQLSAPLSESLNNLNLFPNIDIVEDENTYKIELEMAGMSEEDIHVSLDKNVLTVYGEKSASSKDDQKNYLRREIEYGYYQRSIALPDYVDIEHAKASFKKGMLWVTIPKNPESASKKRDLKIEKPD